MIHSSLNIQTLSGYYWGFGGCARGSFNLSVWTHAVVSAFFLFGSSVAPCSILLYRKNLITVVGLARVRHTYIHGSISTS